MCLSVLYCLLYKAMNFNITMQEHLFMSHRYTGNVNQFPVTVTEALVLRPLLEDRGRITESIRILLPVDRMKQKCFQITTKRVGRLQQFQFQFPVCKYVSK